jgi:hypothetical protein
MQSAQELQFGCDHIGASCLCVPNVEIDIAPLSSSPTLEPKPDLRILPKVFLGACAHSLDLEGR